jgi:ABC-type antimicrobial peptide transport system permease subunit
MAAGAIAGVHDCLAGQGNSQTASAFRTAFTRVAPAAALFDMRSMEERLEHTISSRRVAQSLVLTFAGVAVLLAAIGIYGLLAFLLTQRRREIGIRVAIGCRPASVFSLFLGDGLKLFALGMAAGMGVAAAMKPWIAAQLYGVSATEPAVIALVTALLTLVAVAAISVPAWRASRLDPVSVLGEN